MHCFCKYASPIYYASALNLQNLSAKIANFPYMSFFIARGAVWLTPYRPRTFFSTRVVNLVQPLELFIYALNMKKSGTCCKSLFAYRFFLVLFNPFGPTLHIRKRSATPLPCHKRNRILNYMYGENNRKLKEDFWGSCVSKGKSKGLNFSSFDLIFFDPLTACHEPYVCTNTRHFQVQMCDIIL